MPPNRPPSGGGSSGGGKKKRKKKKDKKKSDKPATKRTVMRYAAFAFVLSLIAGFMVYQSLTTEETVETTFVARAADSISPLDKLTVDDFTIQEIPADLKVEGALSGKTFEEVEAALQEALPAEAFARVGAPQGSQFDTSIVALGGRLGGELDPNERLMTISARIGAAMAGGLYVGDHVDIVAVGGAGASTIASNIEIVDISMTEGLFEAGRQRQVEQELSGEGEPLTREDLELTDPLPGLYTIRVPQSLTNRLALVAESASLYLVYRPPEANQTQVAPVSLTEALCSETVYGDGSTSTNQAATSEFCEQLDQQVQLPEAPPAPAPEGDAG